MWQRWLVLISVLGLVPALSLSAGQPPPLVAERPGQSDSSTILPRGFVQLELGGSRAERREEGVEEQLDALPETLVRVGLSDAVELRLGFGGLLWSDVSAGGAELSDDSGAADSSLGVKARVLRGDRGRPEIALIATLGLPTGADEFSSDRADPAVKLALSHALSDRLSLTHNLGAAWSSAEDPAGDRDTLSELRWTVNLGVAASARTAYFVEAYGAAAGSAGGAPTNGFDAGVTWQARPNLQLDLSAGAGLSRAAPDWFAGAGVVWRYPR